MAEPPTGAPVESVHSPSVSAHISHAVIATYAAAAAREVPGVRGIADGHLGLLERRAEPDRAPRGVRVVADGDRIGLELHVVAEWGARLPDVAAALQKAVREYLTAMIELDVRDVAVVIDDVAPPA
ncbi:MAG: Asp23/Gls24 family envelope stress response protein [Gaiellales bacterium]